MIYVSRFSKNYGETQAVDDLSFDVRASAALQRTAQVRLSGERLRQVVEAAGRRVLKAQQDDTIAVTWHAEDCTVAEEGETIGKTRVYTGWTA